MAYRKKYKALILKQVPCILKYMAYIFRLFKYLKNNALKKGQKIQDRPQKSALNMLHIPLVVKGKCLFYFFAVFFFQGNLFCFVIVLVHAFFEAVYAFAYTFHEFGNLLAAEKQQYNKGNYYDFRRAETAYEH